VNCKHAGFTLLEVTIVLLIMAGVMAIGWPRIRSASHRADLKGAALTVRGALMEARDIAVRDGRAVQFICRLDSSEFYIANALNETEQERLDERPRRAGLQTAAALKSGSINGDVVFYRDPADVTQPSTGPLTVTFFPDGRSTQTDIHLAFAELSHCIKLSVRGLTGGVSIHPVEKILMQDAAVRDLDPRSW
jgi:prepilin-type N-terminal cleavage/methylation domain-containing protein